MFCSETNRWYFVLFQSRHLDQKALSLSLSLLKVICFENHLSFVFWDLCSRQWKVNEGSAYLQKVAQFQKEVALSCQGMGLVILNNLLMFFGADIKWLYRILLNFLDYLIMGGLHWVLKPNFEMDKNYENIACLSPICLYCLNTT